MLEPLFRMVSLSLDWCSEKGGTYISARLAAVLNFWFIFRCLTRGNKKSPVKKSVIYLQLISEPNIISDRQQYGHVHVKSEKSQGRCGFEADNAFPIFRTEIGNSS